MAVSTLVATPGAVNANTYCDLATADQYHQDRPAASSTWEDADEDQKNAALLWATKLLDRYFSWYGSVVVSTQKLLWPRNGLSDINDWNVLDNTTIPDLIKFATAELARQVLESDRTGDSEIATDGITLIKVGSIRVDFGGTAYAKPIPDIVVSLIPSSWGYLRSSDRELERA